MTLQDKLNKIVKENVKNREKYLEIFALAYYLCTEAEDMENIELVEQRVYDDLTKFETKWFFRRKNVTS